MNIHLLRSPELKVETYRNVLHLLQQFPGPMHFQECEEEILVINSDGEERGWDNEDDFKEKKEVLLKDSDFITLHVPSQDDYIISKNEFEQMKDGVGIINTARGGLLHEVDLVSAISSGKIQFAGLDVFETEPTPAVQILMNSKISLTPHIGAATNQAQDRIGSELATQIISILK